MKKDTYISKYNRAKRRVDRLRAFYTHLTVYIIINSIITIFKINRNLNNGESFSDAFYDFATLATWLLWGIAIAIHAFSVFGLPLILGKNWEEDKIEQYMEQDSEYKSQQYE